MAPELHQKKQYQGRSVDLFATGIVLFIMVAGHPPFMAAKNNDPYCRQSHKNQYLILKL